MRKIYKKSAYKQVFPLVQILDEYITSYICYSKENSINQYYSLLDNEHDQSYTCLVVHLGNPLTVQSYIFTYAYFNSYYYISLKWYYYYLLYMLQFIVSLKQYYTMDSKAILFLFGDSQQKLSTFHLKTSKEKLKNIGGNICFLQQ